MTQKQTLINGSVDQWGKWHNDGAHTTAANVPQTSTKYFRLDIKAHLVDRTGNEVVLEDERGTRRTFQYAALGESDRKYLDDLKRYKNKRATRTWSDATGKFTVEAEYVASDDKLVILKKKDGTALKMDFSKLSARDQAFCKE